MNNVRVKMLKVLKESASSCTTYVRMGDLAPGRYEIRKFCLRDSQYGTRLVIEIEQGYVYLPEKMLKKINTEKAINKINKDRYDLVYEGKDDGAPNRLNFTFEKHDSSDDEEDDINENNSNTAGRFVAAPKKQNKK